jgi:hypothetical protein
MVNQKLEEDLLWDKRRNELIGLREIGSIE